MTTDEAKELIRGAVPGTRTDAVWADLGSGSGTFTFALAELLGPDATVIAVDREEAALESLRQGLRRRSEAGLDAGAAGGGRAVGRVLVARGDFREPERITELEGPLHGALFANALHFDPDPGATLARFAERLAHDGRLGVVEYQVRPPNPWVPHPLPVARLEAVAADAGLQPPMVVGERPSSYGGVLYCASVGV